MASRAEAGVYNKKINYLRKKFPKTTSFIESINIKLSKKINSPKDAEVIADREGNLLPEIANNVDYESNVYTAADSDQEDSVEEMKSPKMDDAQIEELSLSSAGLGRRKNTDSTYFNEYSDEEYSDDESSSDEELTSQEDLYEESPVDLEDEINKIFNKYKFVPYGDSSYKKCSDEKILEIVNTVEEFIQEKHLKFTPPKKVTFYNVKPDNDAILYDESYYDDSNSEDYEPTNYSKEAYGEDHPIKEEYSEYSEDGFSTEETVYSTSSSYSHASLAKPTDFLHKHKPSGSLAGISTRRRSNYSQ